jgi:diacylglycerol kinase family enzyme
MPVLRRVAILFNPISGAGRASRLAEELRSALAERGFEPRSIPTRREPAAAWLPPALEGSDAVIVVGGDGAVRLAAGSVAEAGVPLYHAPAGTENLFARAFGMSASGPAVVAALERGESVTIDLARFNGEPFTIMASVGFDADVVHRLAARRTGAITHWNYVPVILGGIPRWRAPRVTLRVEEGAEVTLGTGILVVGNMPVYGFGLHPVRQADASDGLLDATFLPCAGGLGAIQWMVRCWLAGRSIGGARCFRGKAMAVRTEPPGRWQVDGDPTGRPEGEGEVRIAIWPKALRLLRPTPPAARQSG